MMLIDEWFTRRGWAPFPFQCEVWQAYLAGKSGLIHAATGTGKTYAAWLGPILEWLGEQGDVRDGHAISNLQSPISPPPLRVLWITPLRVLAGDTEAALRAPLDDFGIPWTVETRTGDTSSSVRARQRKRLPSALITTPESLSLLLTQMDAANLFCNLRLVVVDEWHELMSTKRGVQTELALARLRRWCPELRTWGLSATMGSLDAALATLVGIRDQGSGISSMLTPDPRPLTARLVQGLIPKAIRIDSLIPDSIERFPWAGHMGLKLLPQVVEVIEASKSTLVFTNTRAQTELWYQAILDARPEWAGAIALHHGSLDRDTREWVERALHDGQLRAVVCTSSLDLGVDFAPVDTTIQIGSPKGIARLLQRAGRSGHQPGAESHIICAPTHAFELIEFAAARTAALAGEIEARSQIERALDVLAQHIVTVALGGGFEADDLLAEVRTTYAYRNLTDAEWNWTLDFAARGGPALQNYPEYARVTLQDGRYVVVDEQIARRHRMSIGTITSDASLTVQYLRGPKLGSIEESFVSRLKPGERFIFAGRPLEFVRVRDMTAWVRRANGAGGSIPRWMGGRMPFSSELASAVRAKLDDARAGVFDDPEMRAVAPILRLQARWSHIPAPDELLIERVKTREGHHLFFYPFEGRSVHEGLAALCAYRLSRITPISFTIAVNDYGFELLSPEPAPIGKLRTENREPKDTGRPGDWETGRHGDVEIDQSPISNLQSLIFSPHNLLDDITASLNATEMAKRQFREIARVAGLIFQGYPGNQKSVKQVQASSSLIYDVFQHYDPENMLLQQARREVLERQLEQSRMRRALERIAAGRITIVDVRRPTPLAFPLLVDRLRETVSSEKFADRVRKMQLSLEKAAGG
jgi:ATP-dependent Lhr-like helicase